MKTKLLLNKIKTLRQRGDIKKLSAILNMNESTVSRIINNKQFMRLEVFLKLQKFYNKRQSEILQTIEDNN